MPDAETMERVKQDRKEGKSPGTQAGEFVREEIHHVREGKHGARSAKQAIAIGLSKARRAGVNPGKPGKGTSARTKKQAARDTAKGKRKTATSPRRSRAATSALKKEGSRAASKTALSRQAKRAGGQKKAAQTRKRRAK